MSAPFYLYTGPELGEKKEQIENLKTSLKKKCGSDLIDDFSFYANDTRVEDVVAKLQVESLFTPATFIVFKNADLLKKKEEIEILASWAESASKSENNGFSVLVLTSDEISVDSKLEKIVPKENKKIFWEMFDNRKEPWLNDLFRKNGYSLESDGAQTILDMVENNTEELRRECNRLFLCFPQGHKFTADEIEEILSYNREESAFTLFDAMTDSSVPVQKRLENSLSVLQRILLSKNNSSVMIISGLSSCFRKLSSWQSAHSGGKNPSEIELKSLGFTSKKARTQYSRAARIWNSGQIAAIKALLAKTDAEIRSLGTTFQANCLTMMIYEIIVKNGVYASSYTFECE